MSIYYLFTQDPEKAQTVIKDFSRYLQSNFTAIAEDGTISFAEELEHTRAYLAVEQARYEGRLFVEFDTPNTFFRVPALTLQPIVENAVQHGLDPDLEPLYVSVATQDAPGGIRIVVEDTGPGYAPSDGAPHFALDNIRERLENLCGGTLEIEPREAGGTKVTVFVPLQKP
jgi:LytS/YehU family sensor histidine kinase